MSNVKTFTDADVAGKRVLCRVDFNVPLDGTTVTDDTRIRAALPTIESLIERGAKVVLCSHLGRPEGTGYQAEFSLKPVAEYLSKVLGKPVAFAEDTIGESAKATVASLGNGDVCLLENLRFDKREKKNDPEFAKELGRHLCKRCVRRCSSCSCINGRRRCLPSCLCWCTYDQRGHNAYLYA